MIRILGTKRSSNHNDEQRGRDAPPILPKSKLLEGLRTSAKAIMIVQEDVEALLGHEMTDCDHFNNT